VGKCTTGYLGHKWYNVPGGTGGTLNPASPRGTVYPGGAQKEGYCIWETVSALPESFTFTFITVFITNLNM
jgi:hypothetical protein